MKPENKNMSVNEKLMKRLTQLRNNQEAAMLAGDYDRVAKLQEEIDDIILSGKYEE